MKSRYWKLALNVGICAVALVTMGKDATAATRRVQFAGSALSHVEKIRVDQFHSLYSCGVMVMNTGSTDQIVADVVFNTFSSNPGGALGSGAVDRTSEFAIYNPGTSSSIRPSCGPAPASSCGANQVVQPGGFAVAIRYVDSAVLAGKLMTVCAGQIEVRDAQAASPGSMTATGSITFASEMGIVGGQFNGALYMSGTRVVPGDASVASVPIWTNASDVNSPNPGSGSVPGPFAVSTTYNGNNWIGSMQMNTYCSQACSRTMFGLPLAEQYDLCNALCGMDTAGLAGGISERGVPSNASFVGGQSPRNLSGFLEETNSADPVMSDQLTDLSTSNPSHRLPTRPFHNPAAGASTNFRAMVRTANPAWAGGYVLEMIMGPYDSICSGNAAYFDRGNIDFSHVDTVDADSGFVVTSPIAGAKSAYPPERLYCSHSHMKDNPYGYVTGGLQFPVNGGMAF